MKRISALGVVLCGLALTAAAEAASPAQCSDYAQREAEYAAPTGSGLVRGGVFVGALSIAGSIFLIEELNGPLGGMITISSAPMHKALALLGQ